MQNHTQENFEESEKRRMRMFIAIVIGTMTIILFPVLILSIIWFIQGSTSIIAPLSIVANLLIVGYYDFLVIRYYKNARRKNRQTKDA